MVSVLSKLKQRIIWKWEDENTKFSSNIMARKWIPQADILAHKNVKLYIGHGGIFGLQESIWYAKPIIVFPSYGDQHQNGHKVERDGIGLLQSMKEITAESFMKAIQSVLNNATIYENVKMKSEIFRTNQNSPLDNAIWWIEYVIKFKGAPHIQSPARDLAWFRYLSLDIAFVIFGAIYTIYDLINQAIKKKIPDEKTEKDKIKKKENKKTK
jgi:glucuronosyltransferase